MKLKAYPGEQGLEQAMDEMRDFKTRYNRLPTSKNKERGGIMGAIERGEWASYGINSWNDLIIKTLGTINKIEERKLIG